MITNSELIAYLLELRDTKQFPIAKRPTDTMLNTIIKKLKNECFWWWEHSWGKWENFDADYIFRGVACKRPSQKRVCQKCGLQEERLIP